MTTRWRRFLEPVSTSVDSYVKVSIDSDEEWPSAFLKIADCTRSVSLGFDFRTKRQRTRSLRKLSHLEQALALVRTALEEGNHD
jgi:hypothetical protein